MKKYTQKQAQRNLPDRKRSDNKTRGGKSLVVAGSVGMWGAAVLAARACARSGAGYVYVSSKNFPSTKYPDFLLLNPKSQLETFSAVAIGPGLNRKQEVRQWIQKCLRNKCTRVVLDAEALNVLSAWNKAPRLPSSWIMTPHEGELSRLLKVSSQKIKKDRMKYVRLAQKKFKVIVLLKGHRTLVCDDLNIFEIQSGNAALAKAGTGDVLTGIILGFLSQGLPATHAACLGAFVHGFIADEWIQNGSDILSLMASDIVEALPLALSKIRKG